MRLFWQQHPALLYGLALLLGISSAISGSLWLFFPLIVLSAMVRPYWKMALVIVVFAGAFGYVQLRYTFPDLPREGIGGKALFSPSSVRVHQATFSRQWIYSGTLDAFEPAGIAKGIPVSISLPSKKGTIRPPASGTYAIEGTLKRSSGGRYFLQTHKGTDWKPISSGYGFGEWRYQAKEEVKRYIKKGIPEKESAAFLAGITTGDFDDPMLAFEFGRFGLQHIMAISGFHFAIIAALLLFPLRLVTNTKSAALLLSLILTSYFLFLGTTPSIMRAWLMIIMALIAYCLERRNAPLNALGIAVIVILLYDPLMVTRIGFQFSVLATASILFFYPAFDLWLQKSLLPKRELSTVAKMPMLDQHGYLLASIARQGIALLLAVNLAALPLMAFYFHRFPWLSLLYNLFFPFMVSLSVLFLIVGAALGLLLPPIGAAIHQLNSSYTQFMLNMTSNMPVALDITWYLPRLEPQWLILYVTFLILGGIYTKKWLTSRREAALDLAFL